MSFKPTSDQFLFVSSPIAESTRQFCEQLRQTDEATKPLFEGVLDFTTIRTFASPPAPEGSEYVHIESRESGRFIKCRVARPKNGEPRGVLLHFHSGGLVIGSEDMNPAFLQRFADASSCVSLSVGYRLAPEHPFPAPIQDCFDVADHLVKTAEKDFGGPLKFFAGESAGGYLALQTLFHLLGTIPNFSTVEGLILSYGLFSWALMPSAYTLPDTVMLDANKLGKFRDLVFGTEPDRTSRLSDVLDEEFGTLRHDGGLHDEKIKHPAASPLFRRLDSIGSRLPPILFICGTSDPLLSDTILMSAHWTLAGGDATVKLVPGAPHGFVEAPTEAVGCSKEADNFIQQFIGWARGDTTSS